jgi:hypothetical protein
MLSCQGPASATGDANGDGLTDVLIGGAQDQAAQLYVQTGNGYVLKKQIAFEADKVYEDVAASFFDADTDGDLDLMIASGGNNRTPGDQFVQPRLYFNDGKGNFSNAPVLPKVMDNTSIILANDIDNDGDEDLFIGSRNKSYSYGISPASYLWMNDGKGNFIDKTQQWCKALESAGMITGALFTDLTGDGKNELIITGEWMNTIIFQWNGSLFSEFKTNLTALFGWWQTVYASDLDSDGDEDLVLGNYGENFYLKPTATSPIKLYINDFDNNSIQDKLFSKTVDGKDVPVFLKRELQEQIPSLKKQNLKHADFAVKTIQTLFPEEVVTKSVVKQVNYSANCIAWNNGNGNFTIKKLPAEIQLSSVNAVHATDVNKDGRNDLILAGNIFNFQPQFSRLDASYGWILINKGNTDWELLPQKKSGLFIKGQVRAIKKIETGNKKTQFLFLQNNDVPVMYQLNNN